MAGDDLDPNKMSRSDFIKPKETAAKAPVKTNQHQQERENKNQDSR